MTPETQSQIDTLAVTDGRPLIVVDADEVLLQFLPSLERFLDDRGLWLDLRTYQLDGHVKSKTTGVPVADLKPVIRGFYDVYAGKLDSVPEASRMLGKLADRCEIVVLSNVPAEHRGSRTQNLADHGMSYPLIVNSGLKGPAVAELAARANAPVFFIDDADRHLASARPHAVCIRFIADTRLAGFIDPTGAAYYFARDWLDIAAYIERTLDAEGF